MNARFGGLRVRRSGLAAAIAGLVLITPGWAGGPDRGDIDDMLRCGNDKGDIEDLVGGDDAYSGLVDSALQAAQTKYSELRHPNRSGGPLSEDDAKEQAHDYAVEQVRPQLISRLNAIANVNAATASPTVLLDGDIDRVDDVIDELFPGGGRTEEEQQWIDAVGEDRFNQLLDQAVGYGDAYFTVEVAKGYRNGLQRCEDINEGNIKNGARGIADQKARDKFMQLLNGEPGGDGDGTSTSDDDDDDDDDEDPDDTPGSGSGSPTADDPPATSSGQDSDNPMGDGAQVDLAVLTQEIPFGTPDGPTNAEDCVEYLQTRASNEEIDAEAYSPELARTICESQYREHLAGGRAGAGDRAGDERVLLEEGDRTGTDTRSLLDEGEFGVFARISSGVWVSEIADALERAFCAGDAACRDGLQLYGPGGLVEFLAVANGNVSDPSVISAGDWLWIPPKECFTKLQQGSAAGGTDTASVEQGEFCQCYYDPTRFPAECPTCQTLTQATETANNLEQGLGAVAMYGGSADPGAWEQATTALEAARQEQGTLNESMGEVCQRAGGAPPSE